PPDQRLCRAQESLLHRQRNQLRHAPPSPSRWLSGRRQGAADCGENVTATVARSNEKRPGYRSVIEVESLRTAPELLQSGLPAGHNLGGRITPQERLAEFPATSEPIERTPDPDPVRMHLPDRGQQVHRRGSGVVDAAVADDQPDSGHGGVGELAITRVARGEAHRLEADPREVGTPHLLDDPPGVEP